MADTEKKYLDTDGLLYVKSKIKSQLDTKVDKVTGKGLSTNDFTDELKTKLDGIATGANKITVDTALSSSSTNPVQNKVINTALGNKVDKVSGKGLSTKDFTADYETKLNGIATGAEVNKIDSIKVNGTAQAITSKAVDITVPTKTSDITNDSNFAVDSNYVHTDNNYTTAEKTKLSGIATGAEVNKIDSIKVNGTAQTITSKAVNITVPTNNNQLTNGAGYQTASQVESAITAKGYQTASDVSSAIASAITSTYKASGSIAFANLPSPSASVVGNVYNITDSFTTTANFVEGAGKTHPAGTNVAIVKIGDAYKYDVMAGFIDLSGYVENTDLVAITNTEIDAIFDA